MKTLLVAVLVSVSSFVVGCSGADPGAVGSSEGAVTSDATEAAGAETATAATKDFAGSFEAVGTNTLAIPFNAFTFKADGTYSGEGGCDGVGGAPTTCHAITSVHGKYTLAKVGGQLKITMTPEVGSKEVFFFSHDGNTITFNKTLEGSTAYFFDRSWKKHIPIGDVCQDNAGKSLGECADSGNFGCGQGGDTDVFTCTPLD